MVGIDARERSWLGPDSVRTQTCSSRGCRPRREPPERHISLRSFRSSSWVWGSVFTRVLVPPTAPGSNLNLLLSGVEVAVKPRHAKVRRDGYRSVIGNFITDSSGHSGVLRLYEAPSRVPVSS